jgi:hypothetical protein
MHNLPGRGTFWAGGPHTGGKDAKGNKRANALFSDPQPINDTLVALELLAFQIVQQPPPLSDKLEQAPTRMVVFLVDFEVFRQVFDARTE